MSATLLGQTTLYPSITLEAGFASSLSGFGVWNDAASTWNTAEWGPDVVWTDISAYVAMWETSFSVNRVTGKVVAGTLSVTLRNNDGRFTPANTAGPYVAGGVTQVRAKVPIRLRATWSSTTYGLFRGRALTWQDAYPGGGRDCVCTLTAIDLTDDLARLALAETGAVGAGELAGVRIRRIVNAAGWSTGVEIDAGVNTIQATTYGDNVLALCQLTADSDGGVFLVDGDGSAVFHSYTRPFTGSRSTSAQLTIAATFEDIEPSSDSAALINVARYTRVGGAEQSASDSESVALNGEQTDERTDLICETDAQALTLAGLKVLINKDPEYRIAAVQISPARTAAAAASEWPSVLGAKFRDLHAVSFTHPGGFAVARNVHVTGFGHMASPQDGWRVRFEYSSATPFEGFWGDANWDQAQWNSGTWFL